MIDVNIVSTDKHFCRLLELETTRLGFSSQISEAPISDSRVCLMDSGACTVPPPAQQTFLVLFGENASDQLAARTKIKLGKSFLLTELRRVLQSALFQQEPLPEKPARPKAPIPREPSDTRLTIHHKTKTAVVGNGEPVKLSDTEYRLLCRLRESGKKPLAAADVTDILGESESNKFNVYVCYLRRKLERGNLRLIRTVRGKGYLLQSNERTKP